MVLALAGGARRATSRPHEPVRAAYRYNRAHTLHTPLKTEGGGGGGGGALHERLVAYVHALSAAHEPRAGVWREHSYARARGAAPPAAPDARVLLAPPPARPAHAAADTVDVEHPDPPPPEPPYPTAGVHSDDNDDDSDNDADDWEEQAARLAPTAECARLVERVSEILRSQRLAALVGGVARREAARVACRRLRTALAPAWAAVGAPPRAPAWLHATLTSHLPRGLRSSYEEMLAELRRSAPRLADRMGAGASATATADRSHESEEVGPPVASGAGPWLVWLEAGAGRGRWARRLRALVHTRALSVWGAGGAGRGAPGALCAAAAGGARAAFADILADAGERPVVVGGAGGGAALAAALAAGAGARVRGLVLLAPLLGAGAGAGGDEPLADVAVPVLAVCGGAGGWARGASARGPARRVLEVRGADAALRVPPATRARLRLPQYALDAAVAEECVRWTLEVSECGVASAEGGGEGAGARRASSPPPLPPPQSPPGPVRHHLRRSPDSKYYYQRAAARDEPAPAPPALAAHADDLTPAPTHSSPRSIEIVEGRVVSRISGGTPLALLPPRRAPPPPPAAPPPAPAALDAADIMQMPIVFADDEGAGAGAGAGAGGGRWVRRAGEGALTVRSGRAALSRGAPALRYARVIVAKRGGAAAGGGGGGGARGGLLLRRAARRPRQ